MQSGEAYWIDDFPPLDGVTPKRRPAIYIDLTDEAPPSEAAYLLFVGTTTGHVDRLADPDAIFVPLGLPQPSWVLPRWIREVPRSRIGDPAGRLAAAQTEELLDSILARFYDFPDGE